MRRRERPTRASGTARRQRSVRGTDPARCRLRRGRARPPVGASRRSRRPRRWSCRSRRARPRGSLADASPRSDAPRGAAAAPPLARAPARAASWPVQHRQGRAPPVAPREGSRSHRPESTASRCGARRRCSSAVTAPMNRRGRRRGLRSGQPASRVRSLSDRRHQLLAASRLSLSNGHIVECTSLGAQPPKGGGTSARSRSSWPLFRARSPPFRARSPWWNSRGPPTRAEARVSWERRGAGCSPRGARPRLLLERSLTEVA